MRRVMIEVRRRQHDPGRQDHRIVGHGRRAGLTTSAVPPNLLRLVSPSAIAQVSDNRTMRPTQTWQRPCARMNRTQWLTCGQSIG